MCGVYLGSVFDVWAAVGWVPVSAVGAALAVDGPVDVFFARFAPFLWAAVVCMSGGFAE